jgi:hypothetical protein
MQGVPEKVHWTCHVVFQQSESARADALDKNWVEYTGTYIVTKTQVLHHPK